MSKQFTNEFINENMMGPNCLFLLEELIKKVELKPNMRVLDLGCGKGLTSLYLAMNFDVTVYAFDLWINATENYQRIKQFNLQDKVIPIYGNAEALPFAEAYFDVIISIDSYQYYGYKPDFLDTKIAPFLKPNGTIAITVPGFKNGYEDSVPEAMKPFWNEDWYFYTPNCWQNLWRDSNKIMLEECSSALCHNESWLSWLATDNCHAGNDREMMKAEKGLYFDSIQLIGKKV